MKLKDLLKESMVWERQAFKDMANEGQQTPVLLKRLHKLAGEFLLELHHFKNELKYVDDATAKAYHKVFTKTEDTIDRFIVNVLGSSRLKKISKSPLMASKRKKG